MAIEIHACLGNDVDAFDFSSRDLAMLEHEIADARLVCHASHASLVEAGASADIVLSWDFEREWYAAMPRLKAVFTPAAGRDWIAPDPAGRVPAIHGTFHGDLIAESLIGAMLFMNHRMIAMMENRARREWNRNLQAGSRLISGQSVIVIGMGHIGTVCAERIASMGARVTGFRRHPDRVRGSTVAVRSMAQLDESLPDADHVVLLVPGDATTDRLMGPDRISRLKRGAFLYNFGRGNSLATNDLLDGLQRLGGAFLDVVDQEPLDASSPLWLHEKVMITPHSSCVYAEYKPRFLTEVIAVLRNLGLVQSRN